jgi:hypothetical protein
VLLGRAFLCLLNLKEYNCIVAMHTKTAGRMNRSTGLEDHVQTAAHRRGAAVSSQLMLNGRGEM